MLARARLGRSLALSDLPAGDVKQVFDLKATALAHLNDGKFETLAIASKAHNPQLPQVPAMSDGGAAGHKVSAWFGVFAPAGLPDGITQSLTSVRPPNFPPMFVTSPSNGAAS